MTASRGIRVRRGTRQKWVAENDGKHFCKCGCRQPIPIRPEHFHSGVPNYLRGHNAKVNPPGGPKGGAPLPDPKPCACGCGELITPKPHHRRKPVLYISGHNSSGRKHTASTRALLATQKRGSGNPNFGKRGSDAPGWTGGIHHHGNGYIMRATAGHPYGSGSGNYVMDHRLVLEGHLRTVHPDSPLLVRETNGVLYLRRDVEVHHRNGIKTDNRLENLQPLTKAEHAALHHRLRGGTLKK